jgi:L-aminopeptidase/D-esterase-like protein
LKFSISRAYPRHQEVEQVHTDSVLLALDAQREAARATGGLDRAIRGAHTLRADVARDARAPQEVGVLQLREIFEQRWVEMAEATAQFEAVRDAFWGR